ncbi:MAG: class I SAM-dependent methyltransferase [Magnetococcales bacterium]|nr:class I SAM-dependent methyltransferase [Magnetococcales bacterium]MBF0322042.1 class I SAM-dependent methyltransferase [Magnetococcales bacterium]
MNHTAPGLRHGDFTGLAENYGAFRPAYAESVLVALLNLLDKPTSDLDVIDVGAGTGIWTRMLAGRGLHSLVAVEPNDDMRTVGQKQSTTQEIIWRKGKGEETGEARSSADLVTMASSFHWVDFDRGLAEFHRLLRPHGRFAALWNPRYLEDSPLLKGIEATLHAMVPELSRVSSGRAGLTHSLTEKLRQRTDFTDVVYMEAFHKVSLTPEQYLGVWWSVNDVRVQAGEERFSAFMDHVAKSVAHLTHIETTYQTRLWTARKVG